MEAGKWDKPDSSLLSNASQSNRPSLSAGMLISERSHAATGTFHNFHKLVLRKRRSRLSVALTCQWVEFNVEPVYIKREFFLDLQGVTRLAKVDVMALH